MSSVSALVWSSEASLEKMPIGSLLGTVQLKPTDNRAWIVLLQCREAVASSP